MSREGALEFAGCCAEEVNGRECRRLEHSMGDAMVWVKR